MNSRVSLTISSLIVIDTLSDKEKLEVLKAITDKATEKKERFSLSHAELVYNSIKNQIKITKSKSVKSINTSKTKDERSKSFYNALKSFVKEYSPETVRAFFDYWSESGESDKKMRFEKETSWNVALRLKTWKRNEAKFNKDENNKPSTGFDIDIHPDLR